MNRSQPVRLAILSIVSIVLFIALSMVVLMPGPLHRSLFEFDAAAYRFFANLSRPAAHAFLFLTYLANAEVIIAMQVACIAILILFHRRALITFFVSGLIGGELVSFLVKNLLARERPPVFLYDLPRYSYSFPSGHALIATVFYGFAGYCLLHLAPQRWQKALIVLLTVLLVFLIGFSRIALGFHWASDVIGGWLAGGAVLAVLIMVFRRCHDHLHSEKVMVPHGPHVAVVFVIAMLIGFLMLGFYVTHPLKIRSTIDNELIISP